MAGKPKRTAGRHRRPLIALAVKKTLLVGALVSQDLVGAILGDSADDELYGVSLKATWSLANHTAAEGPIDVGFAHGDYTDAEVEEWLESQGAWDRSDMIQREHSRRKCRRVGTFAGAGTDEVLNDGKPITTPVRFVFQEGQTLRIWAFNSSSGTLTTGASIVVDGLLFARSI